MPDLLIDPAGRLQSDLLCRACRYNLRGAMVDGACPECGQPVSSTITMAVASGQWSVVNEAEREAPGG